MSTGVETFDQTIQKAMGWLRDIAVELGVQDRQAAYSALHATLTALRDLLTVDEAAQLAAELPMIIRGAYYKGWDPSGTPVRERHLDEFLDRIENALRNRRNIQPEQAARAVFAVLANRISQGEISDVVHMLPKDVRELWPNGAG